MGEVGQVIQIATYRDRREGRAVCPETVLVLHLGSTVADLLVSESLRPVNDGKTYEQIVLEALGVLSAHYDMLYSQHAGPAYVQMRQPESSHDVPPRIRTLPGTPKVTFMELPDGVRSTPPEDAWQQ